MKRSEDNSCCAQGKGASQSIHQNSARETAQQEQGHPKASTRTGLGRWLSRHRGTHQNRAGEMAQQAQGLTAKLDDLNLISRAHMVERELTPTYFPLIPTGLLL